MLGKDEIRGGRNVLVRLLEELKTESDVLLRAWGKLYELLYKRLRKMIFSRSDDISDYQVDEVINKTFDRILEKASSFRGHTDGEAISWIFRIAQNLVTDFFREEKKNKQRKISIDSEEAQLISDPSPDGQDHIELLEQYEKVRQEWGIFLGLLTEKEKTILGLVFKGKKNSEIADILGVSRSRISQVRKTIADKASILKF